MLRSQGRYSIAGRNRAGGIAGIALLTPMWVRTCGCRRNAPPPPQSGRTRSRTGYGREDTQPAEAATGRGVASAQLVAHTRQTRIWPAARWRHRPLAQRHGHRQLGSRNAPRSA